MRSTSLRVNRCSTERSSGIFIWPNLFGSRPRIGSYSALGNSELRPIEVQKFWLCKMCAARSNCNRVAGRSGAWEIPRAADKERPAAFTQGVAYGRLAHRGMKPIVAVGFAGGQLAHTQFGEVQSA